MNIFKLFGNKNKLTAEEKKIEKDWEKVEQQENYLDILAAFQTAFSMRFEHIKEDEIDFSDKLDELTKGDIVTTSHALMDIHEALNVKMDYVPLEEYEKFATVKEVIDYFLSRYDFRINIENASELD